MLHCSFVVTIHFNFKKCKRCLKILSLVNNELFNHPFISTVGQVALLYLPTQIRFLIGGERVTCHRSKLHDALGQQQLELSTHT